MWLFRERIWNLAEVSDVEKDKVVVDELKQKVLDDDAILILCVSPVIFPVVDAFGNELEDGAAMAWRGKDIARGIS